MSSTNKTFAKNVGFLFDCSKIHQQNPNLAGVLSDTHFGTD
jgi:hypothetical protein